MLFNKREIVSCVVVECIYKKDPDSITEVLKKFKKNTSMSKISNIEYLMKCPAGSLIVRHPNPEKYIIVYPFFSSHISLPVKPGEHVWVFFPDGKGSDDIGYWMTRRATDEFIEDLNFTNNTRSIYKNYNKLIVSNGSEEEKRSIYYGVNGRGFQSYGSLLNDSEGNKSHVFESVEKPFKKPSDLVLQGSNNTQMFFTCGDEKNTGTILMTTGRGSEDITAAQFIENEAGKEELNKASDLSGIGEKNEAEGALDLLNDRTVFFMSENPAYLNEDSSLENEFDEMSHIFARSDKIRLEARENIVSYSEVFSIQAEKVVMGSGSEPYIKYSDFESLIKKIVEDINTLALQIAEINGVLFNIGSLGPGAVTGTPSSALGPVLAQAAAILNPPGTGDSEKVYNATLGKRASEIEKCKSEKIFGE